MARKITWSENAKNDRTAILKYWIARNKSNRYSKKVNLLFKHAINLISKKKVRELVTSLLNKISK